MCNRDNKQAKPGAAGKQRAHEASPASKEGVTNSRRISQLEHLTEEDFTSINAMLTTLSCAIDCNPERLMPEDMQAFCWQVYLIHQKVEELKGKITTFDHN